MVQAVSDLARPFDHVASGLAGEERGHLSFAWPGNLKMEALFTSMGVVALAEIGDKTQLLAFVLAARFKKPLPIIAAILCATLVNHGLAGALGAWITSMLTPEVLRWVVGLSFLGMAVWTMIPDKIEEEETQVANQ